jgi:hypothetical protein
MLPSVPEWNDFPDLRMEMRPGGRSYEEDSHRRR